MFLATVTVHAEPLPTLELFTLDSSVVAVVNSAHGPLQLRLEDGRQLRLRVAESGVNLTTAMAMPRAGEPGMLPDGEIVRGWGEIARAWLARPTDRYGHGVLGDAIEAASLVVETVTGERIEYLLDGASVFEDRFPRLADLDGDGTPELFVVRSYRDAGAALAIFTLRGRTLLPLAETTPIGLPYRWLNPLGAADLDGDGRLEIALVTTPHIGGVLRIYRLEGRTLVPLANRRGYSNHVLGSRALGLGVLVDLDADGIVDLLLPDRSRTRLDALIFRGGSLSEAWQVALPAAVATDLAVTDVDGRAAVVGGLADGQLFVLRLSR